MKRQAKRIFGGIAFGVGAGLSALTAAPLQTVAPPDDGLFPFVIRPDAADSAADMSALLKAPAGRDGFLRCDGERLVDGRGDAVRLNGVNLTGRGNFPAHDEADRLAAHFARLGLNCVRLHYFDTVAYSNSFQKPVPCLFTREASGRQVIDGKMRDRLEYLIAALKRRGIFVNLNLHVARELGPADGVPKTAKFNRGTDFFNRTLIDAEKAYAREILRRVNPYTGLALADDPAMTLVELNNENALMQVYWSNALQDQGADPRYLEEFHRLREAAGYRATTNGINKFIIETEMRYFREMAAFLKEDLGVKCPVIGTQQDYTATGVLSDTCDVIDSHIYWTHPGWDDKGWRFQNMPLVSASLKNMRDGRYNILVGRGARRVKGRPFVTSECAAPYPNWYGAEFQPMIHAYAAFQGWAGVFAYSWNNAENAFPDHSEFFFSYSSRTDCLAHFPAAAAMFLRGDVAPAMRRIDVPVDVDARLERPGKRYAYEMMAEIDLESASEGLVPNDLFLRHAVGVDLRKGPVPGPAAISSVTNGPIAADTREVTLCQAEGPSGRFAVDAPNVKHVSGFLDGRRVVLGGIAFEPGRTKLGWCAISLVSRNGDGFGPGARLLLSVTGYTHNGGATFAKRDGVTWGGDGFDLGCGKVVTEGVPLKVTLPAGAATCWALDEAGARKARVPVSRRDGNVEMDVGPAFRTVWYEIDTSAGQDG